MNFKVAVSSSVAKIIFEVAEITFKVASEADISLLVAEITFPVSEIIIKKDVITICDIDRAIPQYTFFGNGGTNLHKNDT